MADMAQKRRRSPAGEEHAQARVTWDEVAAIRQRVADGETQAAVASDYNITQQRVSAIVRDVAWRSNGAQA